MLWNPGDIITADQMNAILAELKFGGDGSDGALSISSGTTTIDCAGASVVIKNYSSISITGTGSLAFSNSNSSTGTIVILRCSGNVTITTSATRAIDLRSMGGGPGDALSAIYGGGVSSGGSGGAGGGSASGAGSDGSHSVGAGASNNIQALGGRGGRAVAYPSVITRLVLPGGNGSAGSEGGNNSGAGATGGSAGRGGGALYIECAGAYECTGTIDASGATGGNGGSNGGQGGGAGGGGAGGNILVLYNTLTGDSGTYTVTGGNAGSAGGGSNPGTSGGSGANGAAVRAQNKYHGSPYGVVNA